MQAFKVVVVGDGAVGKTCLLMCYTQKMFPREYIPTVFDNFSKNVSHEGTLIRLDLYDTAGQEDYDRLRVICYPNTDVFLVCYSVENESSLANVTKKWAPELTHHASDAKIILVGLKKDLRTNSSKINEMNSKNQNFVSQENIDEAVEQIKAAATLECSALEMKGIDEVFVKAIAVAKKSQGEGRKRPCCTVL